MNKNNSDKLINRFLEDPTIQTNLAETLNLFSALCASIADKKGFHTDEKIADVLLRGNPKIAIWAKQQILQAEFGRIMSEAGEAIEAVRTGATDDHLPEYPGWMVEIADILIRCGDTAGKREADLGDIVVEKMRYNLARSHKHGKNS